MNKAVFLEELKQHLKVLEESEQQDILDEYSVHIAMKMERGMSEEEAIRDFGDIRRLAQDILEAYHLDPQYADKKSSAETIQEKAFDAAADGGAAHRLGYRLKELSVSGWKLLLRGGKRLWRFLVRCAGGLWRLVCRCCRKIWLLLCLCGRKLTGKAGEASLGAEAAAEPVSSQGSGGKPSAGMPVKAEGEAAGKGPEPVPRKKGTVVMLGDMLRKTGRLTGRAVRWTLRWCWNLLLLGTAVLAGICAICLLFSFGVLTVLLIAGYPVWGVAVATLGGFLSSASLTLLLLRGIRRKKQVAAAEPKLPEGGGNAQEKRTAEPAAAETNAAEESAEEAEDAAFFAGNQEVFIHA
ncbi:MAG: DUF1700 domain-containing protein [Lachnospiraceae bacterium]|nr:DUF1700 domain-containing protein [Lachnospiraceae bacterium]